MVYCNASHFQCQKFLWFFILKFCCIWLSRSHRFSASYLSPEKPQYNFKFFFSGFIHSASFLKTPSNRPLSFPWGLPGLHFVLWINFKLISCHLPNVFSGPISTLTDSCIHVQIMLHIGACANITLLTFMKYRPEPCLYRVIGKSVLN